MPIALNVTLNLVFDTAAIVRRFDTSHKEIKKMWCDPKTECRWRPKTIAIIQDKATGLVFTGASKATAVGIPPLEIVAYNINVIRLGKKFREKFDKCNDTFRSYLDLANTKTERPPDWFKKLQKSSTDIRQHLPKISIFQACTNDTGPSSEVICLALNTLQLSVKNPCTRCQCFYHTWNLIWKRKLDMTDKWELFKKESPWNQFTRPNYGFNYCAETVAAAQVASLHTGNVISDVQE